MRNKIKKLSLCSLGLIIGAMGWLGGMSKIPPLNRPPIINNKILKQSWPNQDTDNKLIIEDNESTSTSFDNTFINTFLNNLINNTIIPTSTPNVVPGNNELISSSLIGDNYIRFPENIYIAHFYQSYLPNILEEFPESFLSNFTKGIRTSIYKLMMSEPDFSRCNKILFHFTLINNVLKLVFRRCCYYSKTNTFEKVIYYNYQIELWPIQDEGPYKGLYKAKERKYLFGQEGPIQYYYWNHSMLMHLYRNLNFLIPQYAMDKYVDFESIQLL